MKVFTLIIFLLTVLPSNAQLSLDTIIGIIKKQNPELNQINSRIRAYNEYARGAKALEPPQIGAGFFMTPYNFSLWKTNEMGTEDGMGSFMISGQQMFTNPHKRNANSRYMQTMSAVDSSMKIFMTNELVSMAKMNYYEWMIAAKKLSVLQESEILITYLLKSAELKYTYGMDKLNAYYKAKAMLGEIQSMKLMIAEEIEVNRILLLTLMNRNKDEFFTIDTSYTLKIPNIEIIDSSIIALKRSDYQKLNNEINLLQAKIEYESSFRYPDYGIRYDHMVPFGNLPQQFSIMVMISIPVVPWSSEMYLSTVRGLQFEIDAIREQQQSLLNSVEGQIKQIIVQMNNKFEQLKLTRDIIIPSMKKNYDTELLAYEQNTEMLFMVIDAWQNLKTAQLTYLDQLMEIILLQIEFEKQLELK